MDDPMPGPAFPGDNNEPLRSVQIDLCPELSCRLFTRPRERYLSAARVLGVETEPYLSAARLLGVKTELTKEVTNIETFNQQVLQSAYEHIAAYYRLTIDTGQIPLFSDEREELCRRWTRYFDDQVYELTSLNPFVRAILTAVAFQNTPVGRKAEQELLEILRARYETENRAAFLACQSEGTREPLNCERDLMRLLGFSTLEALERWLNEPVPPEVLARFEDEDDDEDCFEDEESPEDDRIQWD
jgi:hypothetical protein